MAGVEVTTMCGFKWTRYCGSNTGGREIGKERRSQSHFPEEVASVSRCEG